jgi:hypothetical protein
MVTSTDLAQVPLFVDAIAALSVNLTDEQVARLELPYTSRMDYQGVSDPMMLARAVEAATGFKSSAA